MVGPEDVERILTAVGPPAPQNLNRSDFLLDIQYVDAHLAITTAHKSSSIKNRQRELAMAAKAARRLRLHLSNAGFYSAATNVDRIFNNVEAELRRHPHLIERAFNSDIKNEAELSRDSRNRTRSRTNLSPLERVVSHDLVQAFEKHFGVRATLAPNGRFVRFAEATLATIGVTYARSSIVRALTNAKGRRHMGKTKPKTQKRPSIRS